MLNVLTISRLFWKYFVDSDIAQIVCDHWRQTNKIAYSLYKDSKNQGFSYNLQLLRKKKSNLQTLSYPPTVNWILECYMDLRKKEKDISVLL